MKAYSLELRQKVFAATLRSDRTIREVAELFGVGTSFVNKLITTSAGGSAAAPAASTTAASSSWTRRPLTRR
jgi:transposase